MNIMTKRGSEDNIVTYEHYCDTKADLANIPQDQISLGSVAIVLKDEDDSMGIYLANSNKEWISFSTSGGSSSDDVSSSSGPVLEWTQLVGPEDVFEYDRINDRYTLDVEDCFGWTGTIDMVPWAIIKMEYNGDVFCSIGAPRTDFGSKREDIIYWSFIKPESYTRDPQIAAGITFDNSWNIESAQIILSYMPSSFTSGISIYGAIVTGWNE